MKIGFIGLGNVGGKLAGSLIRNGHEVTVRDLDAALVASFVARGAQAADSPRALCDAVATHAGLLAKGDDATFQNKVHLSMAAAGFDAKA